MDYVFLLVLSSPLSHSLTIPTHHTHALCTHTHKHKCAACACILLFPLSHIAGCIMKQRYAV